MTLLHSAVTTTHTIQKSFASTVSQVTEQHAMVWTRQLDTTNTSATHCSHYMLQEQLELQYIFNQMAQLLLFCYWLCAATI